MLPVEMKIRKNKISSVRLNQIHLIVYRTSAGRVMAYQKWCKLCWLSPLKAVLANAE